MSSCFPVRAAQRRALWKFELNPLGKLPAGEINGFVAAIADLDKLAELERENAQSLLAKS